MVERVQVVADSPLAKQLEQSVKSYITPFGLDEDLDFVAQYIVMMVCNNKSGNEITTELSGLFGDKFTNNFTEWVFQESGRLDQQANAPTELQVQESDDMDVEQGSEDRGNDNNNYQGHNRNSGFGGYLDRGQRRNIRNQRGGGISKPGMGGGRRLGVHTVNKILQDTAEADFVKSNSDGQFTRIKQRCKNWPNCSYPNCRYIHPTKPCHKFPNCPNQKGTCLFIHYGEDNIPPPPNTIFPAQAPFGMIPPPPQQQMFVPQTMMMPPMQGPPVQICKYSDKCMNSACPFAHPTPCTPRARVTRMEWCAAKEQCKDENCELMHPSGSLVRAPEPIPTRVLETCKFLDACENPKCRYRHPRSHVICRDGLKCERLDCLFTHPYSENCRFGTQCFNQSCLYQHPPGRDEKLKQGGNQNVWVNNKPGENSEQKENDHPMANNYPDVVASTS